MPTTVQVTPHPPTADWYQQRIPDQIAQAQATQLGITQDQLYKLYAAYAGANPGQVANWQNQLFFGQGGPGQSNYSQTQQIAPSQAFNWIQNQVNAQKAQAILNPNQGGAAGTQTGTAAQGWGAPSYWGMPQMGGTPTGAAGTAGAQAAGGWAGGGVGGGAGGGSTMATNVASQISPYSSLPAWQQWYGQNVGKQMTINGQTVTIGQDVTPDQLLQVFQQSPSSIGWNVQPTVGGAGGQQPESVALQQMAQIDPASEALRQGLGASYLGGLNPILAVDLSRGAAAPAAGDIQSYLDLYKQIDPQGYAQRVSLAGGMDQFVQQMQQQAALGAQLDPGTIREVEQGTRAAQAARGNVYGTPQLVAETMARGTAGEQRLLQRQQMLQSALGQQQSYLSAGLGLGDVANTLYNQGYNRYLQGFQTQQNARLAAQGAALGYLGSGQTPLQAGSSYLNQAQQNAAMAAQGGPQYNPQSLGQQYTGAGAPSFPQYGLDMSQLAGNWYNNINQANLQAYGLQQAYGQKGGNYGTMGAGIGTGLGAAVGSIIPGIGTAIGGALGGAIGGAAGGAFSK